MADDPTSLTTADGLVCDGFWCKVHLNVACLFSEMKRIDLCVLIPCYDVDGAKKACGI